MVSCIKLFFNAFYTTMMSGKIWSLFIFPFLVCISFCRCSPELPAGDPDNGGLFLPEGFDAVVVVDSLEGRARHLAVNDNGDIYVKLRFPDSLGGNAALRDTDNDGKADIIETFGDYLDKSSYGTAMRIHNGYLYYSSVTRILRQKLTGKLVPDSEMELIVTDTQPPRQHDTKPIAFDKKGNLYTPFGAPSDACQEDDRVFMSPGIDPCPILEHRAGIWKFDANKKGQFQKDGEKFATGLRSVVALEWNDQDDNLFTLAHGRDHIYNTWPEIYTVWEGSVLPSEVFLKLKEGSDAGWPYHYYNQIKEDYFLSPEYGGDGKKKGENVDSLVKPLIGFPGHFAPNDLLFYTGDQFPEHYKDGAFMAFHGSTSSAPYPQTGYFIAFVPMAKGMPSGHWEVFADGFAEVDTIINTSDAKYRPMGLAMGPDGSVYVSDTEKGKIWRVMYKGDKGKFGKAQLAKMEDRKKQAANIKTPDEIKDIVATEEDGFFPKTGNMAEGAKLYNAHCALCHQKNGRGNDRFPPLNYSDWVNGDRERLIDVVLNGLEGEIMVHGRSYNNVMPKQNHLKNEDIALILTYIRQNFGNRSNGIVPEEVAKVRTATAKSP